MTPEDLRAYLDRFGLSQAELARQLDVSRTTVNHYLSGKWPIPKVFELALKGLKK
jgi:transcriptional regulator with XRE-family HTH domain